MPITLYDLLGVDAAGAIALAEALELQKHISLTPGLPQNDTSAGHPVYFDDNATLLSWLQQTLSFQNVRPGVDGQVRVGNGPPGQVTLTAEMKVAAGSAQDHTLYLRRLPDLGITLQPTMNPARCFFASDGRGYELLVEGLPVKLTLKSGILEPAEDETGPPQAAPVSASDPDSYHAVLKREPDGSEIYVLVRLHLTPEGDVILEPNVPLSLGKCRILGLPARAVYDLLLIPSPNRREYFEWARNDLSNFLANPPVAGAIGVRSVDFDTGRPAFVDVWKRLKPDPFSDPLQNPQPDTPPNFEVVFDDVVIPLSAPGVPIPSHATIGFRRRIVDRTDVANAFSLQQAPIKVKLYHSDSQAGAGGTSCLLVVERFLLKSGTPNTATPPVLDLQAGLIWQGAQGHTVGGTIGLTDDWTVQLGLTVGDNSPFEFTHFTLADATISLHALKLGVSLGRLLRKVSLGDSVQVLGDVSIISPDPAQGPFDFSLFKLRSLTGKPLNLVLRDVGWSFGQLTLRGLQAPDGVELTFAETFHLIIEEMGWVEESDGASYFSFSGGVSLGFGGGDNIQPSGVPQERQEKGAGIRFRRLRFRTAGNTHAPLFKLDGLFLNLRLGPVLVAGFGYITDETFGNARFREMGFGVEVQLPLFGDIFLLAFEYLKGNRIDLTNPSNSYDYFLAALALGWLPAGPAEFTTIRALFAHNLVPNPGPPSGDGQGLDLYRWHRDHDTALELPANRRLAAWQDQNHSFAVGAGFGCSLNACGALMHLGLFALVAHSETDTGVLVVGEAFLLTNPKPIAFVAVEIDTSTGKFGILFGVQLTLVDLFAAAGNVPDWLANIVRLTGTLYFGNQPWTFAIGQLADQRTWLTARIELDAIVITGHAEIAVCLQIVDGGPVGYGMLANLRVGENWGIGAWMVFGGAGLIIGPWKTGSSAWGVKAEYEVGFKISLFFILSFGLDIKIQGMFLATHPVYLRLLFRVHIDTPWWLPDVTITFDKTWNADRPFDIALLLKSLSSAAALAPANSRETALLVPALSDDLGDPTHLYSFNGLLAVQGAPLGDIHNRNDIPVVPTDATIVLNLTNPVSNDSRIPAETPTDAGVQQAQGLQLRYGLQSVSVRRSPRFGPRAGTWTDFLTPQDTELDLPIGASVHALSSLSFHWDADVRTGGQLAPTRLLLNAATPYTVVIGSPQNDEEALRNDPDFPCCPPDDSLFPTPPQHELNFQGAQPGTRLPQRQQFSGYGGWWQWIGQPTPMAGPGYPTLENGAIPASVFPTAAGLLGSVDLPLPAYTVSLTMSLSPMRAVVIFEGYNGLQMVAQERLIRPEGDSETHTLNAPVDRPLTRLVLRVEAPPDGAAPLGPPPPGGGGVEIFGRELPPFDAIRVFSIRYSTVQDAKRVLGERLRCHAAGDTVIGKLAFLPNHDYEVTISTQIQVTSRSQGTRQLSLSEPFYFRTRGLPGLNAVDNVGDELRPYVESAYPPAGALLIYREEPIALVFCAALSTLLPVDRTPTPSDPPEKAQLMQLVLNVDRISSNEGQARLTVSSQDWLTQHRSFLPVWLPRQPSRSIASLDWLAHRRGPLPPISTNPLDDLFRAVTRHASSEEPDQLRYENVRANSQCADTQPLHASQILLHAPLSPNGAPGPWQARTSFRATVRAKDGPHLARSGFDPLDVGAFLPRTDGGAAPGRWTVNANGALVAPQGDGGRQYAVFGEPTWDHLQVRSRFDPMGAPAGIAVCIAEGSPVPRAVLATVEPDGEQRVIVLRARTDGAEAEWNRSGPLPDAAGAVTLSVTVFDDMVRAEVGNVLIEAPRGAVRGGRVALAASGAAVFAGAQVDGLDQYRFDFTTSRYLSFADHIGSYDGRLSAVALGAAGGNPTSLPALLTGFGTQIASLMRPESDPQARQALFTRFITELCVPLRAHTERLELSRLLDVTGTIAILLETPEPLALTGDVTVQLIEHVPVVTPSAVPPTLTLPGLHFTHDTVSFSGSATTLTTGDRLVRVERRDGVLTFFVFEAPRAVAAAKRPQGRLLETVAPLLGVRPELDALRSLPAGTVVVLHRNGETALVTPVQPTPTTDVTIPLQVLSNGDQTAALLIPLRSDGVPLALGAGSYTLRFRLSRSRWRGADGTTPEGLYSQERAISLSW